MHIRSGISQGDSLSPIIFNVIISQVLKDAKREGIGYRIGKISLLRYPNDAVLIAEDGDDLQRLLFKFKKTIGMYNTIICNEKTQSIVITEELVRTKEHVIKLSWFTNLQQ